MKRKKPAIFDNFILKIVALLFAVVLWLLVTNINDPVQELRFTNVPVALQHTNLITDQNEVYSVLEDSDTVPIVTVRAKRSIIDRLDRDNIVATANVEDLSSVNTIEIKYTSNKYSSEIEEIFGSISTVKLSIEAKKTASFALQTETTGDVAAGYQLGTVTPEQNQVRVSGPESVVSLISSAVARVEVGGATGNISTYSDIKLYDNDGAEIDAGNLAMNITSVKVSVTVLPLKDIPITVETSGEPAMGYMLSGSRTTDPQTVGLAGKTSILTSTSSITIPGEAVNVTGLTENFEQDIDITPYLPEGVTFEDKTFDGIVHVTVGIEQVVTSSVEASLSDVELINIPTDYNAKLISISDGSVTVTNASDSQEFHFEISGLAAEAQGIRVRDLAPTIDVAAVLSADAITDPSGTHQAAVQITLSNTLKQVNTVTAVISLENTNVSISESSNGEGTTDQE